MINLTDETGAKVFESLQISLVCDACLKTEHPEKARRHTPRSNTRIRY